MIADDYLDQCALEVKNVIQILENVLENSLPYLKYSYKKYRAVR